MKKNDRREFLKNSLLGISGAAIFPGSMRGYNSDIYNIEPAELPTRLLGKTGIKTPLLSFGTSGALDTGFIRSAYEAGIKMFFSATYYGEGNNEKIVGEGLKSLPRDSYIIGTAVPADNLDNRTGLFKTAFDPGVYVKKAEGSLNRFGTDYVDFVLFPYAGKKETLLNEGLIKALGELKKQGKTRFLGIASHSDTIEALNAAVEAGIYDVAMISYNFKIKDIGALDSAISKAAKAGIGIVAMKTTAGVFRDKSGTQYNSDAILKWALKNENISSVVSGMTSLEQLTKNITMLDNLELTEKELKDLSISMLDSKTGLYCQQCRQCIPQCSYCLDIPSAMRSYMYAYGYRNPKQAYLNYVNSGLPDNPCSNCAECKVSCPSGFDLKAKISDISRIRNVPEEFLTV